jgi:hypothetical protein
VAVAFGYFSAGVRGRDVAVAQNFLKGRKGGFETLLDYLGVIRGGGSF